MKSFLLSLAPIAAAFPSTKAPRQYHEHAPNAPGLADLALEAGLEYFGTAIDNVVLDNEEYTSIAFNKSEFNQVTASNGLKWVHIEPERGVFNWTLGDQVMKPSKEAGQIARCHTFLWHSQLPDWLNNGNWTKDELLEILENHIKTEGEYYKDDCIAWDVANECFNDNGTFRESIWYNVIGEEYLEHAFNFAKKYVGEGTKLYYNDYGIERVNNKSIAVAAHFAALKEAGVPVDGIGLQAHFTVGRAPNYTEVTAAQKLFTQHGFETALTELDVRINLPVDEAKLTEQGRVYANSVEACIDELLCVGVTVWDFWDKVSWVPEAFPGNGSACLWDDDLNRKPAYYAVADMLRGKAEEKKRKL